MTAQVADLEGHHPPHGSKYSHFHAVFQQIFAKTYGGAPCWVDTPSRIILCLLRS